VEYINPPARSGVLVLFDLDGTLSRQNTFLSYLAQAVLRRPSRLRRLPLLLVDVVLHRSGSIDDANLKERFLTALLGGLRKSDLEPWTSRFVESMVRTGLLIDGVRRLEQHRADGHEVAMLTASPDLYVEPLASALGIRHVLCSRTKWEESRFTGRLAGANCKGEEKVKCLELLKEQLRPSTVIAYADDFSDLPLLRAVDRPVLVNPRRRTRAVARHIPIERWT
jgi:phosphatidylglycerophosphatase C